MVGAINGHALGGGLVMMAGAALSLLDRRLRVGAPSRRRKPAVASAGLP